MLDMVENVKQYSEEELNLLNKRLRAELAFIGKCRVGQCGNPEKCRFDGNTIACVVYANELRDAIGQIPLPLPQGVPSGSGVTGERGKALATGPENRRYGR